MRCHLRIAVCGAHHTGKTTLIEALAEALPDFAVYEEPWRSLEAEGHPFAHPPERGDYEAQLERSLQDLLEAEGACLFERCPLDLVAYLAVLEGCEHPELSMPWSEVEAALECLDLIVSLPIENPDPLPPGEDTPFAPRAEIAEVLQSLLQEEQDRSGLRLLEVSGSPAERCRQVLDHMRQMKA